MIDKSIGIDLGIKELVVTSDNEIFRNVNKTVVVKKLQKRLKRKQRQISRKYLMNKEGDKFKKTKNIVKLENKIKLLNRRLSNIRNNHIHQVTTQIVKTKPMRVVMEDLNVKGMMKNKHLSKSIGEQGFSKFISYMRYKCANQGTEFVLADRFYPSSKLCSSCGTKNSMLKLKDRIYKCVDPKCKLHTEPIDRDYNASLNLSKYVV